jgi:hypothetical protein
MTGQESRELGIQLGLLINEARRLDIPTLQAMVSSADRYDTLEPILDPTGWMRHNGQVANMREAARIVLEFRRAIADMDARRR